MEHDVFGRPFAEALRRACSDRELSQKQIGALIAANQAQQSRLRGPERQKIIEDGERRWPRLLSSWKKGRLPATLEELFLALDVIAPGTLRSDWVRLWQEARSTPTVASNASNEEARDVAVPSSKVEPPSGVGRSAYLHQVARIAHPDQTVLQGRDTEMSELIAFCLTPEAGAYQWWRASAWAGKSMLLATFVLHPPAILQGKVRIVSFFITAQWPVRTLGTASLTW